MKMFFVRMAITIVILILVYFETGPATALCSSLIWIAIELMQYQLKKISALLGP